MQVVRDMENGFIYFIKKYLGVLFTIAFILAQRLLPILSTESASNFCILGLLIALSIFIGGILPGALSIAISLAFCLLPQVFIAEPLEIYKSFHFKTTIFSTTMLVIFLVITELKYKKLSDMYLESQYYSEYIEDIPQVPAAYTSINGNFLMISDKICNILDYSKQELLKLRVQDVTYAEDREKEAMLIEEMLGGLRSDYNIEKRVLKKNGEMRWIYKSARLIRYEDGTIKHISNYMLDITERKNADNLRKEVEENLRLLNKAIEEDRLKSEFFSNVSHELRTPLNVIMGTLQLLALYKEKGIIDCRNMDRHIKIMKQNCFRLLRLINNLIDSSKIDTGFFKIKLERYDIVKLVEDISLSIVDYIESNGLELVFDTNIEEKVISCDPNLMERIILNLLANAIKFTDPGGKISVNVEIYDEDEKVNIIVKDTGIGIAEDQLDTIFDRFKQASNSLSRERGGSGIGLALTKSLVEMHKGNIRVNSKIGEGTEFIISLPVGDDKVPHKDASRGNEGRNTNKVEIEFSDIYS